MALTPGEETVLKAVVAKIVQKTQAKNDLATKRAALQTALSNFQAAIDAAKIVNTHNGTTEETIDPGTHAAIKAVHEPLIQAAKDDLAQTLEAARGEIA